MQFSTGENYWWNRTKPENPEYSPSITGTVVNIQGYQNTFNGQPKKYSNGNPRLDIRFILVTEDGRFKCFCVPFAFSRSLKEQAMGNRPKGLHYLCTQLPGVGPDLNKMKGRTFTFSTDGRSHADRSPIPWQVEEVPDVVYQAVTEMPADFAPDTILCDEAASGGQVNAPAPVPQVQQYQPAPQQFQVPYPQQVPMQYQPTPQQMPPQQQTMMPQQVQYQPVQQSQPMAQQNVATQPAPGPYDADIPF